MMKRRRKLSLPISYQKHPKLVAELGTRTLWALFVYTLPQTIVSQTSTTVARKALPSLPGGLLTFSLQAPVHVPVHLRSERGLQISKRIGVT